MTVDDDLDRQIEERRNKEDNPHFKECWNCDIMVSDQEAIDVVGRKFCSERCKEEWIEDRELKAEGFEDIRKELGLDSRVNTDKVVQEVINQAEELTMRKEGFK